MSTTNILLSVFLPTITFLIGIIGYFLKDKVRGLAENDHRLDQKVDGIKEKIDKICDRISNLEGRFGIGYSVSSSPIHLTEKGEELLTASGAKKILDNKENQKKILDQILADPKPKTAYDAQEKTKEVIEKMVDEDLFIPVKDYVFQKGIELEVVLHVSSIYFRDIVLDKLQLTKTDL